MNKLDDGEWLEILNSLERHHAIFYRLWQMGKPVFTKEVDTAAVQFDKVGNFVVFLFNPEFWESINLYNKLFIISHECLHILLNHGARIKDSNLSNRLACNQCLDIVVNHSLIDNFGFERPEIRDESQYCWVDTVFPGQSVSTKQTFEHYYNLFEKAYGDGFPSDLMNTVDDHLGMDFDSSSVLFDAVEQMSAPEVDSLSFLSKHAGDRGGLSCAIVSCSSKKKRRWESLITAFSNTSKKILLKELDQWAKPHRRISGMSSELFLPSDLEVEDNNILRDKIKLSFFMDSSGSCWDLKDRFFGAATSLDQDFFDVSLFCFDTFVYEVNKEERKLFGGGGTSFAAIEVFLQSLRTYPDGVFVITDGYGDKVLPQFPNRWHWFLTENAYSSLIPKGSNKHYLSDFE